MQTARTIRRTTMFLLSAIASNALVAQAPSVDDRYKTPNPRTSYSIMAGSNFAVTQDGIRMLKDGNVLSIGGDWQSYMDVAGTRNILIDVGSSDKPVRYAGLVFREACTVNIEEDGTLLVDKTDVGAVDANGRAWRSRSVSLNGKTVIAFFADSNPPRREPPPDSAKATEPRQEAWQESWPAFVAALAAIQDSCIVPPRDELFNVMNADVIKDPQEAVVWLLDRSNPRSGTCQAIENATFGDREVKWQAVVAGVGKPDASGEISIKLTPEPSPDARYMSTASKIIYVGAVVPRGQLFAVPAVGQRIVVRGTLPRTRSDSFQGVIHNYGARDSRERSFVVDMRLALIAASGAGELR